jgi:hypothetical protein
MMQDNDFGRQGEQARPGMPNQQGELAGQQGASPFPDQHGQPGVEPGQEPSLDRYTEGAMTDQYTRRPDAARDAYGDPQQSGQPGQGQYDPTDPDAYAREHGEDGEGSRGGAGETPAEYGRPAEYGAGGEYDATGRGRYGPIGSRYDRDVSGGDQSRMNTMTGPGSGSEAADEAAEQSGYGAESVRGQPAEYSEAATTGEREVVNREAPEREDADEEDGEREAAPGMRPVRSVYGGGPQQDDPYGAHNPRTRETEERALDEFIEEERR